MTSEFTPSPSSLPPPPPAKKGLSTGCIVALVLGILAVLGVIVVAVLAAVAAPYGRLVLSKAHVLQAKSAMNGLEIAIKSYAVEYSKLPSAENPSPILDNPPYDTTDADGKALLEVLNTGNHRKIRFWEPPPGKPNGAGYAAATGLRDPWGQKSYKIILDYNNDGVIADPEGVAGNIKASVLLYSAGPDGDFATWKDNVCSWK